MNEIDNRNTKELFAINKTPIWMQKNSGDYHEEMNANKSK